MDFYWRILFFLEQKVSLCLRPQEGRAEEVVHERVITQPGHDRMTWCHVHRKWGSSSCLSCLWLSSQMQESEKSDRPCPAAV